MNIDEHKPSLKKNFILSFIIQMICYISPLIASPYLTRVLGAESIGVYSFSYSYAHYFILFASFGFTNYGTMIISENRADLDRRNTLFWSLLCSRIIFALVSLSIYLGIVLANGFVGIENNKLMFVFSILIISAAIDFTFFFRGIEKLNLISFATALTNVLYLLSIFLFVKSENDLLLFTILKTLSTSLINVFLIPFLHKRIGKPNVNKKDFLSIIIGSFSFFLPSLVMGISTALDQTLIGIFSNNVQVAYYQQTSKITALLSAILYAASTVILSRSSLLNYEDKDDTNVKALVAKSIILCFFILSPVVAGLYLVGNMFIPLYFGLEFASAVATFFWLLPVAIASSFSSVIIAAYYYPHRKTMSVTIIVTISIIINVALTIIFLLSTNLEAVAAAIGSLIAEVFVTSVLFFKARSVLSFKSVWKDLTKIFASIIVMCTVIFSLNYFLLNDRLSPIFIILLDTFIGGFIYATMLLILKESTFNMCITMVKSKILKR